ncbi:MAG TPA: helix-turn-helix transcriptional regulator [Bacteroidales bacterium]|nr:helix-turn-helix transcriptional regulator [Bacteroidales bacterium]
MVDYEIIKQYAREKKISLAELAERIGYTESGFHKAVANNTLKTDKLIKIAEVLSISLESFIKSEDVLRMATALNKNKIELKPDNETFNRDLIESQERMMRDAVIFYREQLKEKDRQIAGKDKQIDHLMNQLELKDGLIRSIIEFARGMGIDLKDSTKVDDNSKG